MGSSTYSTNWDGDLKQPRVIFHVTSAGSNALNWDDVTAGNITQDAAYVLEGSAVPFDPNAGWQNGDVLPRRIIKSGCGSRSDIKVVGQSGWVDGYWDVTLARAGHGQSPRTTKTCAIMAPIMSPSPSIAMPPAGAGITCPFRKGSALP